MKEKQEHTLQYSCVPKVFIKAFTDIKSTIETILYGKEDVLDWLELFPNNIIQQNSLIFQSGELRYRSIYRKIAYDILIHLVQENKIESKAYYLTKPELVDYWKLYRNGRTEEDSSKTKKGQNWSNASLIILDGVDDWSDKWELSTLESFVIPALQKGVPFIFLTSNELNDDFVTKNGGMTLVSTIMDYSKIIKGE